MYHEWRIGLKLHALHIYERKYPRTGRECQVILVDLSMNFMSVKMNPYMFNIKRKANRTIGNLFL
jgi:hypothetical protein